MMMIKKCMVFVLALFILLLVEQSSATKEIAKNDVQTLRQLINLSYYLKKANNRLMDVDNNEAAENESSNDNDENVELLRNLFAFNKKYLINKPARRNGAAGQQESSQSVDTSPNQQQQQQQLMNLNELEYCIECLRKESKNDKCFSLCISKANQILNQSNDKKYKYTQKYWHSRAG